MPKTLTPFTPESVVVQDSLILSYLTFRDLNQFVEHEQVESDALLCHAAKDILLKSNPTFLNLEDELAEGHFHVLIHNIVTRVLPMIGLVNVELQAKADTKAAYDELCLAISSKLRELIKSAFYPFKIETKLEAETVRDCIFHYSQHNPEGAGKLLNQHIWKFWNSFTTDCIIEYGGDVNARFTDAAYPTLFQALRSNASPYTVQRLIEAGADYDAYQEIRADVSFTLMLVAALSSSAEVLAIVVEKFPGKVAETLQTFEAMLNNPSGVQFSCKFNDKTSLMNSRESEKLYYDQKDILLGKAQLLIAINENQHRQSFSFSAQDKKYILFYIQHQLKNAKNFEDCLRIYNQHKQAGFWHDSDAMCYSAERIQFIEMIQCKMGKIFQENKRKKETSLDDNYYQEALTMLSCHVFSAEHIQNGVTQQYVKLFEGRLRNYAMELEYLARCRQKVEERPHYSPTRHHLFQACAATAHQIRSLSSPPQCDDSDFNQAQSANKACFQS
jgi:hypothetical protein